MSETPRRHGIRLPPTVTEAATLREVVASMRRGALGVEQEFTDPDDDWAAMWLVVAPGGLGTLLTGNADKHVMTEYVGRYARKVGAIGIGHVHSSWLVLASEIGDRRMAEIHRQLEAGVSLETFPERIEVVLLNAFTASAWEMHTARIQRRPDAPPELDPFECVQSSADQENGSIGGAMVDPLQDALRRLG